MNNICKIFGCFQDRLNARDRLHIFICENAGKLRTCASGTILNIRKAGPILLVCWDKTFFYPSWIFYDFPSFYAFLNFGLGTVLFSDFCFLSFVYHLACVVRSFGNSANLTLLFVVQYRKDIFVLLFAYLSNTEM